MTEKKLPFLTKVIACPECGAVGNHRQFRTRAFSPGEVESDTHVVSYVWNDPQFIQVHPPLYFLYFCNSCYFCAASESYIDPESIMYRRVGSKAFSAARNEQDQVIQLLGHHIDYDSINFETALWMHLLAIYIQLLRDDAMRDHYMIARLYLRVAWLYREESAAQSKTAEPVADSQENATQRAVLEALREFDAVLHQANEAKEAVTVALREDAARRGTRNSEAYAKALSTAGRLVDALHSESYRLKSLFNQSYVSAQKDDRSYNLEFLEKVKSLWVYAPADELEALRSAIEHYEKAIASDSRLNDSEPYFRTSALIIDLELRCNDLDAAFKKARGIVASVMKDRETLRARMNSMENPSHKMELKKRLDAANRAVERASDLHSQVVEMVIAREMPKISTILQEHSRSTASQKKVALMAGGISLGIVQRVEQMNLL